MATSDDSAAHRLSTEFSVGLGMNPAQTFKTMSAVEKDKDVSKPLVHSVLIVLHPPCSPDLSKKNPFILHIYTVVTYISDRAGVSKILMTWCMKRLYLITVLVRVIFLVCESLGEDNTDCVLNTAASILKKEKKKKKRFVLTSRRQYGLRRIQLFVRGCMS